MAIRVQETSRAPSRHDQNRLAPWHIVIKTTSTENKERILKSVIEEKQITYKGKHIKITADFLTKNLKARRACSEVFRAWKENNFGPRIFYLAKLSIKIDGGIKVFYDKKKLKQYMTIKPPIQKILKGILHTDDENKHNHKRQEILNLMRMTYKYSDSSIGLTAHTHIHKQQEQLNGRNHHIIFNIISQH
jgi:hypothetical protein